MIVSPQRARLLIGRRDRFTALTLHASDVSHSATVIGAFAPQRVRRGVSQRLPKRSDAPASQGQTPAIEWL